MRKHEAGRHSAKPIIQPYPDAGEIFELTLNGDASENDPIEMVRRDGYGAPEEWIFKGKRLAGIQIRKFKLVSVGYCRNLDEVRQKLKSHGEIPEGQWREAFKAKFPKADGKGSIGVADPSWVHSSGSANFPYVDPDGDSGFLWAGSVRDVSWRWLVAVSK